MLKYFGRMEIKGRIDTKWVNMVYTSNSIWGKVFKNGPSKICGQPLSRPCPLRLFKICLPEVSLGPFLNTLSIYTEHSQQRCFKKAQTFLWANNKDRKVRQKFVTFILYVSI